MYLYLYQDKKINGRGKAAAGESRSDLSEMLVRNSLRDYCHRVKPFLMDGLKEITIEREEKGKPYFTGFPSSADRNTAIHFSISHSGEFWGCIMAAELVGFDMEMIRERVQYEKIADRFFAEDEKELIRARGLETFFDVWVRKEAYVKYLGTGLSEGLSGFSVVSGGILIDQLTARKNGTMTEYCFIRSCSVHPGLKSAYCCASGKPITDIIRLETL